MQHTWDINAHAIGFSAVVVLHNLLVLRSLLVLCDLLVLCGLVPVDGHVPPMVFTLGADQEIHDFDFGTWFYGFEQALYMSHDFTNVFVALSRPPMSSMTFAALY